MDAASYHRLRRAMQENSVPVSAAEAGGMTTVLRGRLWASGLFERVEVDRSDDPDRIVIALCRCSPRVPPWAAGNRLERVWQALAAEASWEAHTVVTGDHHVEFEGTLALADGSRYVTFDVVAQRADEPADLNA